jgi:outer membrane protein assembly factor BamB
VVVFGYLLVTGPLLAANWPQWRGPDGNSLCRERGLPMIWREGFNIAWKTELPGWGNGTPIIWEDAIFLTSQEDDKLLLLRVSKKTGEVVWRKEVGTGTLPMSAKPQRGEQVFHRLHNFASPSPVTDGKTVIAHFGTGLLAAYDVDGKEVWKRNLQDDHGRYTIWYGHANSPIIRDDLVISVCMQDSLADRQAEPSTSYVVAHTLKTGRVKWFVKRTTEANAEECDSYTTPVYQNVKGRDELIVMGGNQVDAYEPATGKQLWFLPGLRGGRLITGPTVAGEYLVVTRGFRGPITTLKLSPEHSGKLSQRAVYWTHAAGAPDSCCPVVWNDLLLTITDDGIVQCFNGFTGRPLWKNRLKGSYKASPIAAEERVYFLNQEGLCTVVSASPNYRKLIENQLDDQTLASPAVSDGQIFIRGRKHLYCIGRRE